MTIETKELAISEELKRKVEMSCRFAYVDYSITNGNVRVFDLYLEGKSHQTIANIFNKEQILNKTNWYDSTIQKILSNDLYKGDFVNGKRTKHPIYYENVVEPIVSKEKWDN